MGGGGFVPQRCNFGQKVVFFYELMTYLSSAEITKSSVKNLIRD